MCKTANVGLLFPHRTPSEKSAKSPPVAQGISLPLDFFEVITDESCDRKLCVLLIPGEGKSFK